MVEFFSLHISFYFHFVLISYMPNFQELRPIFQKKRCYIWDFDKTLVNLNADWETVKIDLSILAKKLYSEDISFQPLWQGFKSVKERHGKNEKIDWTPFNNIIEREENKAVDVCSEINEQGFKIFNQIYKQFVVNSSVKVWFTICSNNFSSTLKLCSKKFDLFKQIDYWVSREMVLKMKPNPEGIQMIHDYIATSSSTRLDKNQMVMFGDSDYDEKAAINFGIDFYYINQIEL
jgi:phosphoglycolate phosphatase-like HAD superfamily hydrolase